ncbi:amidohydrolase [Modestobacter roseus]|uniref:Amidohydrolase 3 domain-containing protein n=1 Tax=Modestobacter roseus TaxID=1181884 RepID=A0A562IPS0_9ACTN|nr:amidohydrolase [Modestobacter roseus]MQA35768.1 amidohydrolase family protein [Modestobacter roseus]TWH72796.1 hypothetical protein JD78_01318 [Modestobacter roseus]
MTATAPADLVIRNARVFTAAAGDDRLYAGLAVTGGRITAVAAADAELDAHVGPGTTVHDLGGASVVPGLFDAHCHYNHGGMMVLRELVFPSHASLDEVLAAVDTFARDLPEGAWVSGGSWGSTLLPQLSSLAARARLDAVSHGHPVHLYDDSHHNAWVNTEGMRVSGMVVDGSGEYPEGTLQDPRTGELLGVLLERATDTVRTYLAQAQAPTPEEHLEFARKGIEVLNSFGVTGIQDALIREADLVTGHALEEAGELTLHISSCLWNPGPGRPGHDVAALEALADELGSDLLRTDFVKLALDGVPPAQTAAFEEPYVPSQQWGDHHCGHVTMDPAELVGVLRHNCENGRSTKIHCAGDASVRAAIDGFEVMRREGFADVRFHIAHGQFVRPEDRVRMAELDVVAEISPFLWYPNVIVSAISEVLTEERTARMHPNRELTDRGVLVAGGSDWPVEPLPNLWLGIAGLVTRADPGCRFPGTLWSEEALTVPEALRAFSLNGAVAARLDDEIGSLEVGKCADFVVIDRDPFAIEPAEIAGTRVLSTWFAGEVVYEAASVVPA